MKTFLDKSLMTILFIAATALAAAKDDGALILERANTNDNIYSSATGEFISHLRGNVVFRFEDMRITSDEATWQKNRGIVDFRNNVKVEEKGQVMTCDRLLFVRENKLLTATGKVAYEDSAKITFITGNNAEYRTDTKVASLWGSPVLTRLDSAKVDTLVIRGRMMKYDDSLKIATVIDNVNIRQGELTATCKKADYFTATDMALLRTNPVIHYEGHKVVGDSIDLQFGKESLKSAAVMGNAHGFYREVAEASKDTTVTNIRSDSLYLTMFESGKMRAMKAYGNARGDYVETASETGGATTTNIASDSLFMFMFETGKVRSMTASGNARGDYSESPAAADSGGSANAMSTNITSDSMRVFMFETGKIRSMRAYGRAHGRSAEWGTNTQDSMITHIWSDSLRVSMSDSGKIRTMKAFGSVRSQNYQLADSARASEISGETLTLAFTETGKIEQALVRGNAKSNYYLTEEEGGGQNIAAGDQIHVSFALGKARRLRVRGNVSGYYAP